MTGTTNIRALLAADPEVGAGNVLTTRARLGLGLDEPRVTFDTEVDGRPAWQPFTLRELDRAVRSRAAALHGLGVRPRDPVALYVSSAADNILGFLALARLGAIPALVNPNLDGERAARYISGLRATGVLLDAEHRVAVGGTSSAPRCSPTSRTSARPIPTRPPTPTRTGPATRSRSPTRPGRPGCPRRCCTRTPASTRPSGTGSPCPRRRARTGCSVPCRRRTRPR
jgi:hypothetical protein